MQKILITGATGFIASHLLPILHLKNWPITAAVRNQSALLPTVADIVTVGSIDANTDWQKALTGIDIVIHLAARAHIIKESVANPEEEFLSVNTEGTINLVKQSLAAGVKQFIFISSIGAMATLSNQILNENSPCLPDTPYGRSKLLAEQALINLATNTNMAWTIIRPTLVYGAGNPGNMERLIKLVKTGLPLPFGAIANRRSFVFVGNLVDAIANIIDNPAAANQLFLVSDGQDISTPELIQLLAKQINKTCYLLKVPPSLLYSLGYLGDLIKSPINSNTIERLVGSLFVDISHIKNTLHWHPPFTISDGIEKTFN